MVDICVATPGRLTKLLAESVIHLNEVALLVLDEADRMVDIGFGDALKQIVSFVPKMRQTLLFSATWPAHVNKNQIISILP